MELISEVWNDKFKEFEGKHIYLQIEDGTIFDNVILSFAGWNMIGMPIITLKSNGVFHVVDWDKIKMSLYDKPTSIF